MPIGDPRAGRAFIWLAASFIFLCLAIGGGFLIRYLSLPESNSSNWLLYTGMTFVGLPWIFWLLMCSYRCISRTCGFRFVCGGGNDGGSNHRMGGGGGDGGGFGGGKIGNNNVASGSIKVNGSHVDSPGNGGKQMHFGAAVAVNQNDHNNQDGNSFHDVSIRSHESEIPLASSMAS